MKPELIIQGDGMFDSRYVNIQGENCAIRLFTYYGEMVGYSIGQT